MVYFTKEFASDSDFLKSHWWKQKYLLSLASGSAVFSARVAWFLIWVSLVPELKDLDATGALKCTIPTLDLQKWRTCRHWQLYFPSWTYVQIPSVLMSTLSLCWGECRPSHDGIYRSIEPKRKGVVSSSYTQSRNWKYGLQEYADRIAGSPWGKGAHFHSGCSTEWRFSGRTIIVGEGWNWQRKFAEPQRFWFCVASK